MFVVDPGGWFVVLRTEPGVGMTLTVTDLFAGAGGSSTGLTNVGFKVLAAANHWPVAISTHQANHPDTEHHTANLAETDFRRFPSTTALWASPSCVWHARSGGRKRPADDVERARQDPGSIDRATAFAVIAAAEVHRYPVIMVENVEEFTGWSLFNDWLRMLETLGYRLQHKVIDAAAVGAPQRRKRWFLVATRGAPVDLTIPEGMSVNASTILDADPGMEVTRRLYVADQIEQIESPGQHLVTFRRNARALRADSNPLATITAGGNHHGVAQVIDGRQHFRMVTNRECARGQGFPDTYQWSGSAAEVKRQIGNAVSVHVAEFIGRRVAESLVA